MTEIIVVGSLFLFSLGLNAFTARWSTRKVLGINLSWASSGLIVLGRSLAALLAGFAIGYAIRLLLQGNVNQNILQLASMFVISILSFLAYWALLGKLSGKSISLWGMTKTVATETMVLVGSCTAIAIVLSTVIYLFNG